MPITVTCDCGKQLRVKDESAGKKGRCPACGNIFTIPAAGAPAAPSRPAAQPAARPKPKPVRRKDSIDLGGGAPPPRPKPKLKPARRNDSIDLGASQCPGCGAPMPSVAVICMRCGHDTRSGKAVSTRVSGLTRTGKTKVNMSEADLVRAYRSWAWLAIGLSIVCAVAALVGGLQTGIITFKDFVANEAGDATSFGSQMWMMLKGTGIPLGAAAVGALVGQFMIRFLPK